ncbi:MAG: hypothetical protein M9939_02645 [Mesorhizobium sp.]|nr:hypothetical protein [Mesorhizobium sp.]MCO5160008.1 hypothetical protein [Mesorhizobium sp.]
MYFSALAGLIAGVTFRRKAEQSVPAGQKVPAGVAELTDHHLRDIGYVRERVRQPRSPLMWM